MRFLVIALSDALVLGAIGFGAWVLFRQWKGRQQAAMCPSCQDLAALRANDNVCPGCGQLHVKP